jgi:flagellar hook-basal body complex protein FliE
MEISQINSLVTSFANTGSSKSSEASSSFTDILSDAMGSAQDTEGAVQSENAALLTGETDDLHTPLIEAQKAELALNLAIQIRNKVISAYNDVMGMQV